MRPQLLAFDLMDTVVGDPFLPSLARLGGEQAGALREVLDAAAWIEFELGLIDEPIFLGRLFKAPSPRPEVTPATLRDAIISAYAFLPGMEALLEELRARDQVRLWVLSNYPPWAERIQRELRLDRFFEGYAISYRLGARKPEAAAYRELCRRALVAPERVLLVDDRLANIEGAGRVGMPGVQFTTAAALRAELCRLGLLAG